MFVLFYYFAYQLTRAHKYFNISHGHMKLGENMDLKSHKEILQIYLIGQNVHLSYSVRCYQIGETNMPTCAGYSPSGHKEPDMT